MKRRIVAKLFLLCLLVISFSPSTLFSAIPLVFVHLGKSFPNYNYTAIRQAALFNPESDIYLIVHKRNWIRLKDGKRLPKNVRVIDATTLPITKKHQEFADIGNTDWSYWRYIIERWYIIEEFMLAYDINELIQLEGDNLVYRNLDELVPVFRKYYPNIGIPFASDRLAIPGLFYVGNKEIVTEFSNAIVALFHEFQGFHDMNFLAAFGERTGKILPLPSLPKTYLEQGYTMVSLEGEAAKDPQFFTSHEEEFNGLFDPLPYGLFLDGPSAAHARYKQPERLNGSVFDPEKFSYIWKRDVQGRRLLYIRIGDQEWPLINLHVHSKDLDKFASYE